MLKTDVKRLIDTVCSWPDVSLEKHRFGGIAFLVNGKEIGHMHGNTLVDLMLPKEDRVEALRLGKAVPHHVFPASNWVSIYLRTETDVDNALEFLQMNYARLVSNMKRVTEPRQENNEK